MPISDDRQQFSVKLGQPSQTIQLSSGTTPFLAYSLPAGTREIEIQSYPLHASSYEKAEVFYPEVILLDQDNQVIRTISKAKYQRRGIIATESLTNTVRLNHIEDLHAACLLIFTSDKARLEKTPLMNQAKEYARVRGNVPPPIPDVMARHGNQADLSLSITLGGAPPLTPMPAVLAPKPVPDSFNHAMKSHYLEGTRKAIADKNVKQALALRTEFSTVLQATEGYFVSQFGRNKDQIVEPSMPMDDGNFAEKAIYHYQSETFRYLKTGQASSALKLQDSLKQLQHQLDAIFDSK